MKDLSTELKEHLASEVTTLAWCWKITRTDGEIMGFTSLDKDLLIDSITYKSQSGISPSAIAANSNFSVDNLDVEAMISSDDITKEDIINGRYNFAELQVFVVNYEDLSQGNLIMRKGWLGEVSIKNKVFIAEVRGMNQKLTQNILNIVTPGCSANLGDSRCKKSLTSFSFTEVPITQTISRSRFKASSLNQDAGYFSGGVVEFSSGANNGLKMEVKEFRDSEIILALPFPYDFLVSDEFTITAGCDKTTQTCKTKFNNLTNFRGFPHVPGQDKILQTAGTLKNE